MNRIFLLLLSAVMLSGCFSDGMLKKSANNKLIDSKGFHGGKRRPLYNKKYIDKAKLNVSRGDFEDDEYDDEEQYLENLPPTLKNRYMYEDMIEEDIKAERSRRAKKKSKYLRKVREGRDGYPDIGRGRDRVKDAGQDLHNHELKSELKEIRSLLDAAREDLVKYRCPLDENDNPSNIVQKAGPKKKIHEQVKEEEKKLPPTKAPPSKRPLSKPEVKTYEAPKPKSPPVQNVKTHKPQIKSETASEPAPKQLPTAPKDSYNEMQAPLEVEQVQNNAETEASHARMQSNINTSPNNEAINLGPEPSKPEIEEMATPELTEIPPAPSDEIEEVTNNSIPALPSFPTN